MFQFETYFKTFFRKTKYNATYIVGDLNLLDYGTNAKVQDYINPHSRHFYTAINKPTRVTKKIQLLFIIFLQMLL